MTLPVHNCSPLCRLEEGVHCYPNRWFPDKTLEDWRHVLPTLLVLDVRREDDVDIAMVRRFAVDNPSWVTHTDDGKPPDREGFVGYLLFLKEKELKDLKWLS